MHELHQLRNDGERTQHPGGTSEAETDEKEIVASPLLPKQPAPVGFVYPTSQELAHNPYTTQPAYNPSYVAPTRNLPDQPCNIVEHKKSMTVGENDAENVASDDDTKGKDDDCFVYCLIVIVAAIVIGAMVLVIHFSMKYPTITKVIQEVSKKIQEDKKTNDASIDKVLGSIIFKQLKTIHESNGMNTTTRIIERQAG